MATSMAAHDGRLLRYVLEDLHYPARWWEIMAMADLYGLAASNRAELARLPRRLYENIEAVLSALSGAEQSAMTSPPPPRSGGEPRQPVVRRDPARAYTRYRGL